VWGIYEITVDGRDHRALSVGDGLRFPHWSPDGRRLAITKVIDDDDHPFVIDPGAPWEEQGRPQFSDERAGWRTGPWSPDGKSIAVISAARGIGRMDAATLAIAPIRARGSDAAWIDDRRVIVADGTELVVVDTGMETEKALYSLAPARVTELPSLDVSPSRDAVYVSVTLDHATIWLAAESPAR
jgi:hypothetical protein